MNSYGWISTNGSTIPYTFSPSVASNTTGGIATHILGWPSTVPGGPSISASGPSGGNGGDGRTSAAVSGGGSGGPVSSAPSQVTHTTTYSTSVCVTATASPIACPASNGTLYTPVGACIGSSETYMIDCGINYASGGLTMLASVNNSEACIAHCSADNACVAVTFDAQTQSCYERAQWRSAMLPSARMSCLRTIFDMDLLEVRLRTVIGGSTTVYTTNGQLTTSVVGGVTTTIE